MSQKSFNTYAGFVFLLAALLHLWRIVNGYHLVYGHFIVPMWFSWVGVVLAGILAYQGLRKRRA